MAVSFVSSSGNKSSTTSVTITAPSGIQNLDIMVAIVSGLHSGGTAIGNITPPEGWTLIAIAYSQGYIRFGIFYKRCSGESGNYAFGCTVANQMQGVIGLYRGVIDEGLPYEAGSTVEYVTNNTIVRGATCTALTDNGMFIWGGGYMVAGTISLTNPTGYNDRAVQLNTYCAIRLSDKSFTTAGASGTVDATAGASCTLKHAFMLVLKPASTAWGYALKGYNGSSWVSCSLKYYNGSNYVIKPLKIYLSGSWQVVS